MLSPLLAVTALPAVPHIAAGCPLRPVQWAEKAPKIAQTAETAALILKQTVAFSPTAISIPVPGRKGKLEHRFF